VRLDRKFALSWALLSYVDARGYITQSLQPTVAPCEEARQAAETALTLQPNLGDAILVKGFYQYVSNQDAYTFNYRDVILADHPIMYWRLGETPDRSPTTSR
jgi:hypothetical protein